MAAVGLRYLISAFVCAGVLAAGGRTLLPVPGERWRALLLGAGVYALQAGLFYAALGHGTRRGLHAFLHLPRDGAARRTRV